MSDDLKRGARRWAEPADQWRTKVQRWVDAGIVSTEQGEEILALESVEGTSSSTAHDSSRPALSRVVEAASYLGIVVVGFGFGVVPRQLLEPTRGRRPHVRRGAVQPSRDCSAVSWSRQYGDAGARRLSGFLQLIGTAGAAMMTAVIVGPAAVGHHGLTPALRRRRRARVECGALAKS